MTSLDAGLWITWYDLPAEGKDAYLSWLNNTYIPEILKRPGILWGAHYAEVDKETKKASTHAHEAKAGTTRTDDPAVPTGSRYILIFGAEYAYVFGDPIPSAINAALPEASRKMLAMRMGERVNIMTETGRVEGPEAKNYKSGMVPANCIQLGTYNMEWQNEEARLEWYTQVRLPMVRELPGCVRCRQLVSVAGWAKQGIFYEFSSLEDRNKNYLGYRDKHPEMQDWSNKMFHWVTHAPGSANLALRIWPPAAS